MEFGFGVFKPKFIGAVDYPDDSIGLFEIVPPVGSDGLLPSHIPDVQLEVFVLHGLDVEAEGGGDLIDVFAIELFDDGGFSCIVEPEDQQPHFLFFFLGLFDDRHEPHLS